MKLQKKYLGITVLEYLRKTAEWWFLKAEPKKWLRLPRSRIGSLEIVYGQEPHCYLSILLLCFMQTFACIGTSNLCRRQHPQQWLRLLLYLLNYGDIRYFFLKLGFLYFVWFSPENIQLNEIVWKMFNSMDEVIVVNQGSITNPVSAGNVYLTSNPTLINIVVFVSVIT